jgi:carbon storage regulator
MLVLSRKPGEAVCIGSDIKVRVLDIKGGKVRLGLSAPPEVRIHRSEVLLRINGASAVPPPDDSPGDAERPKSVDSGSESAVCEPAPGKRRICRNSSEDE